MAGHFPPSNLAAVHRARLWSQYLPEFGWTPIVVTTHWRYYEERLDPDLEMLVPPGLRVIRTRALSTRPLRLVGDIGVRGFWWHYQALRRLAENKEIDFVHITIPSNFSGPLGRLLSQSPDSLRHRLHRSLGTTGPVEKPFSRAWAPHQSARSGTVVGQGHCADHGRSRLL